MKWAEWLFWSLVVIGPLALVVHVDLPNWVRFLVSVSIGALGLVFVKVSLR